MGIKEFFYKNGFAWKVIQNVFFLAQKLSLLGLKIFQMGE